MERRVRHRLKFHRIAFFRENMARYVLRRRSLNFDEVRPMVSIIGDAVSDRIRTEGLYEREILEFLRDRLLDLRMTRTQVAIDVGANIGNHSLFLSDLFARVIAFEPNPVARSLLQFNLNINRTANVEVRPVGLSDRTGKAKLAFNYTNLGGASAAVSGLSRSHSAEVDLVVGDEAIDGSEPISLIKIDVEGAEEPVLKGLELTIRSNRPVVVIEQWENVIDAGSGTSPSFAFLRNLGYSAWELKPSRLFRGKWGKISSLLLGRTDYLLKQIDRLEKRDYHALFFLPGATEPVSNVVSK